MLCLKIYKNASKYVQTLAHHNNKMLLLSNFTMTNKCLRYYQCSQGHLGDSYNTHHVGKSKANQLYHEG